MIAAPKEEMSGKYFVVEWLPTKERTRFQRGSTGGKILRLQDAGMAGYYNPFALPVPVYIPISVAKSAPCQPTFFIGDQVQINPTITSEELKEKQTNFGGYVGPMDKVSAVYFFFKFLLKCNIFLPQYIGVAGTVQYIADTNVYVKFHGRSWLWIFNPTILQKLNKFSVNQSVRIRSDANTVKQMKKKVKSNEKVNLVPIPKFAILTKNKSIAFINYFRSLVPLAELHILTKKIQINYLFFSMTKAITSGCRTPALYHPTGWRNILLNQSDLHLKSKLRNWLPKESICSFMLLVKETWTPSRSFASITGPTSMLGNETE